MSPRKIVRSPKKRAVKKSFASVVNLMQKQIDKGVKFLDKKLGRRKWLLKIDETALDLQSASVCMLGQSFEHFWDVVTRHEEDLEDEDQDDNDYLLTTAGAEERGFYIDDGKGFYNYDTLTHLWHCRIIALKIQENIPLAVVHDRN